MKVLNKMEQICEIEKSDRNTALHDMLTGYRSTPHPATNKAPYEALMHRQVRTMIDSVSRKTEEDDMDERDWRYKENAKKNKENRNTKEHKFIVGDYVLLKQMKKNKWTTAYEPNFYKIYRIDGSSIAARRVTDGRTVYRDASRFKLANSVINGDETEVTRETENNKEMIDDWRDNLLKETEPEQEQKETSPMEELTRETTTPRRETQGEEKQTTTPRETQGKEKQTTTTPRRDTQGKKQITTTPRRSERPRKKPSYFDDYITN